MELGDRDILVLADLGEYGLMDTEMVWRRHFTDSPSGLKYCQRRLRQFAAAGITEILDAPYNLRGKFQKRPALHRLTVEGASVLAERTGREPARLGRSDPPGSLTLLHRLGCVRVRLIIEQSCRTAGIETAWVLEQDRYPVTERNWPKKRQFVLYESWEEKKGSRTSVDPDMAALLELPGGEGWKIVGLIEYDRSTETHKELLEKAPGYRRYLLGADKPYRKPWPQIDAKLNKDVARILFVCQSRERQRNVASTFAPTPIGALIRVAVESDLTVETAVEEPVWLDTDGNLKAIWPKR